MNYANLKKQQLSFYITLSLCFLISIFFFLRIILPAAKTYHTLRKDIQGKDKELRRRWDIIRQNKQLKEEILAMEATYRDFNQMLFIQDDMPAAVKEIADISADLRIEFISVAPLPSQKVKSSSLENPTFSLWKTPVSIKIKTSYSKLIDFIERIEKKSNKFIELDNLRIKKSSSLILVHDVEMTVYVYSLQQEKS